MKAIIRARVSTKGQEEGHSIAAQRQTDIRRWDFSVMGAKSYVLNLSENVRRSLEYKRRNGE
jgi:DNA invertase Pin-like site-specific DNA recombinase